ncbi:MAG: hypothetical protein KDC45_10960 [Bacteroidetes bacterium]|nr:hypothetical protein [Bacteroidota bacterium]
MKEEMECPGILELMEQAIDKEEEFKKYLHRCAQWVENPKIKTYFEELADEEARHREKLEAFLDDLKAEYAVYEAIVESEEHYSG